MYDTVADVRSEPLAHAPDAWLTICARAEEVRRAEPILSALIDADVLAHPSMADALASKLSRKLADATVGVATLRDLFAEMVGRAPQVVTAAAADLASAAMRDPAAHDPLTPFLYYKGFQALQAHRLAHVLWLEGRRDTARFLQARVSEVFAVDIHPAVPVGRGVFIDHATGLVVGETASIGNDVSILQGVTLGGTGKEAGDRHPQIRDGVLLAAGATVLGNIEVGRAAKVGAGSVVLASVPPCAMVAGVPARVVGWCKDHIPGLAMDQSFPAKGPA